jgi:hypothetical protein
MNSYHQRWLADQLRAALKALPAVVLTGARQAGKTTLAQSIQPDRAYFTLDDVGVMGQAKQDPESLLARRPVTLDEVQRVPELLLAVKRQVDRKRQAGDFLLTGSANLLLMSRISESLAGRAVYLELPPFCPTEWLQRPDALDPIGQLFAKKFDYQTWPKAKGDWQAWLLRGGFPPALLVESDEARQLWFSGYVRTYLERDLRQLSAVSNLPDFQRVMALAANRTGRVLNQSDLARDAALPQPTCHRYLNLLETGCLITRLAPYATNPTTSLVKGKKLLWNDCGLAAWLAGIKTPAALAQRLDIGFWLEQTLFQTLQTWRSLDAASRHIYFWRDRSGREVDFVLEQDGELVALEIKASQQVSPSDAAGLTAFRAGLGKARHFKCGVVLHAGDARPLGDGLYALPWNWLMPADT